MPTLIELANQFANEFPKYGDAIGAYAMCDSTSDAFIGWAADRGYTGKLQRYTFSAISGHTELGVDRPNPAPKIYVVLDGDGHMMTHDVHKWTLCSWHCIVEAVDENLLIDFTARQYKSTYPYPLFISLETANAAKAGA